MKIKSLKGHFGCLNIETPLEFSGSKINLIVADNEEGKTTLGSAIFGALCGLERKKGSGVKDFKKFEPWNSKEYEVEIEMSLDGKNFLVKRDFTKSPQVQILSLPDREDITFQYTDGSGDECLTEEILNLTREEFQKSAFIRQGELEQSGDLKSLESKIQSLLSGNEDTTVSEVLGILDASLRQFHGEYIGRGHIDKELKGLEESLISKEGELNTLEENHKTYEDELQKIDQIDNDQKDIERKFKVIEVLRKRKKLASVKSDLGNFEKQAREINDLKAKENELKMNEHLIEKKDWVISSYAKIKQESELLAKNKIAIDKQKSELEKVQTELNAFGKLADVDGKKAQEYHDLVVALRHRMNDKDSVSKEYEDLKAEAAQTGFNDDEYIELKKLFDEFSITEFKNQNSKKEDLENKIAEKEKSLEEVKTNLEANKELSFSRKRFFMITWIWAVIITIISTASGYFFDGIIISLFPSGTCVLIAIILTLIVKLKQTENEIDDMDKARYVVDEKTLEDMKAELSSVARKINDDLSRFKVVTIDEVEKKHEHYNRISKFSDKLKASEQKHDEYNNKVYEVKDRLHKMLASYDRFASDEDGISFYEKIDSEFVELRELRNKLMNIDERLAESDAEFSTLEETQNKLSGELSEYFKEVFEDYQNIEEAYDKFVSRVGELETNRELIKELKAKLESDETSTVSEEKLQKEISDIQNNISKYIEEEKILDDEIEAVSNMAVSENELGNRLKEIRDQKQELIRITSSFADKWDGRALLYDEISVLKKKREKLGQFKESIELAMETLSEESEKLQEGYSIVLSEKIEKYFSAIDMGLKDVSFADNMSVAAIPNWADQRFDNKKLETYLSVGAKDQLYFAIRLALSEYFSTGDLKAPLILDDVFVNTDDTRFINAFKFIQQNFAKDHQIFILTCHGVRHEWLYSQGISREDIHQINL